MDPLNTDRLFANDEGRAESARNEQRLEIDDIKWLMSNKRGRRVVHRTLQQAGVFRLSFNTNALQMAFAEGNRNAGLRLLALITEHCPDRYTEMLKEAKQ